MTKIITVAGEKGGVGKSTIVVNLAAYAVNIGLRVLLIDADKQRSAAKWIELRHQDESLKKILCVEKRGSDLTHTIRDYARQKNENNIGMYDLILVDTPGIEGEEFRCASIISHVLITCFKASLFDYNTAPKVYQVVNEINALREDRPLIPCLLATMMTTHFHKKIKRINQFINFAKKLVNFRLLKTIIHQRDDYMDTLFFGKAVMEYAPGSEADTEITNLFNEVVYG